MSVSLMIVIGDPRLGNRGYQLSGKPEPLPTKASFGQKRKTARGQEPQAGSSWP
jgi:hypothetical protein